MFRSVLASRASEGRGRGSAQGLNWMGAGIGGGSGQFESIEGPGRCSGRCPGGQAEMGEDLGDHGRIFDACPEPVEGAAMIVKVPPHCGHCSKLISNTRLSNLAKLSRTGAEGGGASA
jgi:hypothetical protein